MSFRNSRQARRARPAILLAKLRSSSFRRSPRHHPPVTNLGLPGRDISQYFSTPNLRNDISQYVAAPTTNLCGYASEPFFKRLFKKKTGLTMREWRKQNATQRA